MVVAGYKPAIGFMSGAGGLAMSFVASANSSSSTITIPGTAVAGDFAVLIDCAVDNTAGGSVSGVTPSGWTNVAFTTVSSSDTVRTMTSYRILTAGQPGTSITGMNSDYEKKFILVFRPSTSIITATASAWNSEGTTGNPSVQIVSASGVVAPLIVLAVASGSGTTSAPSFSTESPAMTNLTAAAANLGLRIGYTLYNTDPSDQSIDMNDVGENALHSGYIRFT